MSTSMFSIVIDFILWLGGGGGGGETVGFGC